MLVELVTAAQSVPAGTVHSINGLLSAHLGMVPMDGMIPNPPVKDPGGKVSESVSTLLGILKWGVLVAILAGGFIGVLLVAIGKWFSHERSGRAGVIAICSAIGAAILFSALYGIITMFIS